MATVALELLGTFLGAFVGVVAALVVARWLLRPASKETRGAIRDHLRAGKTACRRRMFGRM